MPAARWGQRAALRACTQHVDLPGIPIQIQYSNRYRDGGIAAWGSLVDAQDRRAVFKVDAGTGRLVDLYVPAEREAQPPVSAGGGITGSYNILDRGGRFIVPRQREIEVYADSRRGLRSSPIRLVKRSRLPDRVFCRPDDKVAGTTMTYDGYVAFATEQQHFGLLRDDYTEKPAFGVYRRAIARYGAR